MDSAVPFERWLRRPEFSLAIFRPKRIDCAISSGPIARKRSTSVFAKWRAVERRRTQNSACYSNQGSGGFAVNSDRDLEKFLAYVHGLHKRMLADRSASPVALTIIGVVANSDVPSLNKLGRRGRILAKASQHPVRNILLGIAGGAFGGLRMSGWNPIGGVVGGIVGGAIAAVEALC